jgi:hypothetical protein
MLETSNQHPMIGRAPPPKKKKKPNNPQKIKRRTVENAKFILGGYVKFQGVAVLSPPCGPCIWQLSGHLRLVFQYTPGGDVKHCKTVHNWG